MRWFETDGVVLRYAVRHGKGPYLVLVHEMGGSIESWDRVLTHLPPEQGIVLPEMRGMGQSQKIHETSSFGQIAADVAALLDHLAGVVAALVLMNWPQRLVGLFEGGTVWSEGWIMRLPPMAVLGIAGVDHAGRFR